jgi:hypothetical protein
VRSVTRPRLALTRAEAAEALGMSLDSFERYVQTEVSLVRRGRMRLVPIGELERWLAENAERPMAAQLAGAGSGSSRRRSGHHGPMAGHAAARGGR